MFDYAGSFHLHTSYSFDGNTPVEEVIAAAKRQRLDFIVITDHFRLDAKHDGWEGWHDGLLVVVGEEISPRYSHYLALGIEKPVIAWKKDAQPQEYIDAVRAQGGVGLIAHPDHTGTPKFGVRDFPWQDWSVTGYDGISIWDLMTDWQEKLDGVPAAIKAYAAPAWSLSGPKPVTLERWDALNRQGRVSGYGEVDNHNTVKKLFGREFRIFPFELAFSTIRTHILPEAPLSKDGTTACRQVLDAIRSCRMYIAQERWHDAKGFSFRIYDDEQTALTGGELAFKGRPTVAEIRLPRQGQARLLRDGAVLWEKEFQQHLTDITGPGVYRVEVRQKRFGRWKPWIFSNPIWVRNGKG